MHLERNLIVGFASMNYFLHLTLKLDPVEVTFQIVKV